MTKVISEPCEDIKPREGSELIENPGHGENYEPMKMEKLVSQVISLITVGGLMKV